MATGSGQPLPASERAFFEPRFGQDFSGVRIHRDDRAGEAARALSARAFTDGRNVVFGRGEFRPDTDSGRHLLAHELAHVTQRATDPSAGGVIRRKPDPEPSAPEPGGPRTSTPDPKPTTPEPGGPRTSTPDAEPSAPLPGMAWNWMDLLVYPLIIDLWNDVIAQKLSKAQKKELKLKGNEGVATSSLFFGSIFAADTKGIETFGDFLKAWTDNAGELHKLAGGSNVYMDLLSRIIGINLESYLGSDLFLSRLKSRSASVVTLLVLAQSILSTVQAVKESDKETGEFEPSDWQKHLPIVTGLFGIILKEQITAPNFFSVGPLKLKTHPIFAATEFAGGPTPSGLTFEHSKGVGEDEGGEQLKLGLTLNVPQILALAGAGEAPSKDIKDLNKFRGWQGSAWFSFDRFDPTATMAAAGKQAERKFKTGLMLGHGGYLGMFEVGGRYGGRNAESLTMWFLRGGFGYSGKKDSPIKRLGFRATYADWKETDVLAPRDDAGAPMAGRAARLTPFTKLEFGKRHKFGVGAALSFVTGSAESFNLSGFRGDFSYTYMGDSTDENLPAFKLDLSGSMHRLDWWNPNSPLMAGVEARVGIDRFFVGGRLMTGAGGVSEERRNMLAGSDKDRERALVPTSVIFTSGLQF